MTWDKREKKYLKENWTKTRKEEILKELENRTWRAIQTKANRLGLKGRKQSLSLTKEEKKRRRKLGKSLINHIQLNSKIDEFIKGLTLGDGYLTKGKSVGLETTDNHLEYLKYLGDLCESLGISYSINKNHEAFRLRTSKYREFNKYKKEFYPEEKKIIPKTLKITPFILRTWFIDDGWRNKYAIYIEANSMRENDLKYIVKQMEDKEINMNIQGIKNNRKRLYCGKDRNKFFNYIGQCPVECYQYKWRDNIG